MVTDEFAARFVYFYTGYVLAPHIFTSPRSVQAAPLEGVAVLLAWAPRQWRTWCSPATRSCPVVSLALGLLGACRGDRVSALLSLSDVFKPLRYCGEQLDRHLSRVLPADGGDAHVAAQDRLVADIGIDVASSSPPPA